jgi:hypothetical protein
MHVTEQLSTFPSFPSENDNVCICGNPLAFLFSEIQFVTDRQRDNIRYVDIPRILTLRASFPFFHCMLQPTSSVTIIVHKTERPDRLASFLVIIKKVKLSL